MLRATESERDLTNFLANGGDATITSLRTPAAFQRTQEWVSALSTSHEDEVRFYVHAGIRPGVPLDQQTAETKLWIRDSFLRHRGPFPKAKFGGSPFISWRQVSLERPDPRISNKIRHPRQILITRKSSATILV
jgi:hypothetical protein